MAAVLALLAAFAVLFIVLRSPEVSNSLKRTAVTGFEAATGYQLLVDNIFINPFPLYVGVKNPRIFDENGKKIFSAGEVKAYVDLSGLLDKTLLFSRVVADNPDADIGAGNLAHFKTLQGSSSQKGFRIRVKSLDIRSGNVRYSGPQEGLSVATSGLDAQVFTFGKVSVMAHAKLLRLDAKGIPELNGSVRALSVTFDAQRANINKLDVETGGSSLEAHGYYSRKTGLYLDASVGLLPSTVKNILRLKGPGSGRLDASGQIKIPELSAAGLQRTYVDIKFKGGFQIQTLLEAVKADVPITGAADVSGTLKGPVLDLEGSGSGSLKKSAIYGLATDYASFNTSYSKGVLGFSNIKAEAYGGKVDARFAVNLKGPDNIVLKADVSGVSTNRFTRGFLNADLPLPDGRLSGGIFSSGRVFAPEGHFLHVSTRPGPGVPEGIRTVQGDFAIAGDKVIFSSLKAITAKSVVNAKGALDTKYNSIDMAFNLVTPDIRDLTAPDITGVLGGGQFSGQISGTFKAPRVMGRFTSADIRYQKFRLGAVDAALDYTTKGLAISSFTAKLGGQTISAKGSVDFPQATGPFMFKNPSYALAVSMDSADVAQLALLFKPGMSAGGKLSAQFALQGVKPVLAGKVHIAEPSYNGLAISSADAFLSYGGGALTLKNALLKDGRSELSVSGVLNQDHSFRLQASSPVIDAAELLRANEVPSGAKTEKNKKSVSLMVSFTASGDGTLDNPSIAIHGRVLGGLFGTLKMQPGDFNVALNGKKLDVDAGLQGGSLVIKGSALLTKDLPWNASVQLKSGRYDYLAAAFLANPPPDLLVGLGGRIAVSGNRYGANGSLVLDHLNFAAYGQSFVADSPIRASINGKTITLQNISLSSGQTFLKSSGRAVIGKSIDFSLQGKTSLAPFKVFTAGLGKLSGSAVFSMHAGGDWNNPTLGGRLTITDGDLAFKGIPQDLRITSAYLHVDENRLVLENFNGKIGGGDVDMAGVVYLTGLFRPARFYLESVISDVNTNIKGVDLTAGGNLIFKGDAGKQDYMLAGDLSIAKAVYARDVDWQSLIFKKKASLPSSSAFSSTRLNVRIQGAKNIRIYNNLAQAPLSIDLTVNGTLADPIPLGRVEASSGKLFFRNNEFEIEHASVIFADPNRINPVLDVAARTVLKGYTIRVSMSGNLDRFNLAFTSDPYLEEMSILSLLALGDVTQGGAGIGGGIGAAEATAFLTGKIQDVVSKRLKSLTGIDRFRIEPSISKSTGSVTPRVTVSKRLLGDRLYVTYSAPIGSEEQVIKLEYTLAPNISLIGLRDEQGDTGGDLSFRFRFE